MMVSIEAHRAAIGRFSGKARYLSQANACKKLEWIDTALLLIMIIFLELFFYGLVVTTMIFFYIYIMALLMFIAAYCYSCWIIKECSALVALTVQQMTVLFS